MITLYIPSTASIEDSETASMFCTDHVVISVADLKKIEVLAIEHGFHDELRALDVKVSEISPRRDKGAWRLLGGG